MSEISDKFSREAWGKIEMTTYQKLHATGLAISYAWGNKESEAVLMDAFRAGYAYAVNDAKIIVAALEEFKLGHIHWPDLPHTRALGDSYGWCDICSEKVSWGPGFAEEALERWRGE